MNTKARIEERAVALPRLKAQRGFVPYVGRKEEREFLSCCLKDALEGNGCSIFVCGEPGIGKTRLVSTVLDEIESSSNCLVLKGKAYQYEKPLAYQPFTQAIRHLHRINLSQKDFEKVLNPYRPYFQLLLPEISNLENDSQEKPEAKYGLFEGMLSLFLSLSEKHPLVLFIDDLHWMDEQSIELFGYIAHQIEFFPIALLGCYRDAEVLPDGTFARLLSQLKRADLVNLLSLKRFEFQQGRELIAAMLDIPLNSVPNTVTERVFAESLGNPFFTKEVISALMERGHLVIKDGIPRLKEESAELMLTDDIKSLVMERFFRLSEDEREVLEMASVLGEKFDVKLLRDALGWEHTPLMNALAHCATRQFLLPIESEFRRGSTPAPTGCTHKGYALVAYPSDILSSQNSRSHIG